MGSGSNLSTRKVIDHLVKPSSCKPPAFVISQHKHKCFFKIGAAKEPTRITTAYANKVRHLMPTFLSQDVDINFASPLRVDDLASRVQMSTPSFHQHFRNLTSMSPLQYQKWLRLNEAKRLMLNEHRDVATAAFEVGYESLSQFSREYSRMFGIAPKRDISNLRAQTSL